MLQTAPDLLAALNVFQASDPLPPPQACAKPKNCCFRQTYPTRCWWTGTHVSQRNRCGRFLNCRCCGLFHAKPPAALPALVLGGAEDQIISPQDVITTAELFNVSAEIMPNMAHLMMLDTGWERVANRVDDWLNQVFSASL